MGSINHNIIDVLKLTDNMLKLGDTGIAQQVDDNCGILFCVLRDYAFVLRRMAERELKSHQQEGKFSVDDEKILREYNLNLDKSDSISLDDIKNNEIN